jgi:PTS system nitrogen regulatory IIA component
MSIQTLPLAEIARRLDLPTSTVERWVRQGRIPVHRKGELGRFDPRELKLWARDHKLKYAADPEADRDPNTRSELGSLVECIRRGGIHYDLEGGDSAAVLQEAARCTPLAAEHHDQLAEMMLQREELSSTGIGRGVAIPHPRSPLSDNVHRASISVCFLSQELDFQAVDGEPVRVLFVILSPSVKLHLRLLARLAFVLRDEEFTELLHGVPPAHVLLAAVDSLDRGSGKSPA